MAHTITDYPLTKQERQAQNLALLCVYVDKETLTYRYAYTKNRPAFTRTEKDRRYLRDRGIGV